MGVALGRAQTLHALGLEYRWHIGAEIGVWEGQTLFYLLDHIPHLFMYAVDHYLPVGPYEGKDMNAAYQVVDVKGLHYVGRMKLLRMDSVTASYHVKDAELDFAFIDADHSTESVVRDIKAWERKVKPGGSMTGHDADWPSVQAALKQVGREHSILPGNVWHYQRP